MNSIRIFFVLALALAVSGTFADTYQLTTFDRLVGWSRWLLINETAPRAWSPSSFFFKLPLDDMSDIPII